MRVKLKLSGLDVFINNIDDDTNHMLPYGALRDYFHAMPNELMDKVIDLLQRSIEVILDTDKCAALIKKSKPRDLLMDSIKNEVYGQNQDNEPINEIGAYAKVKAYADNQVLKSKTKNN